MLSGHGQNELAVRALRAGAVDCIDKSTTQFLQVVDIVKRIHATHAAARKGRGAPAGARGPFHVLLVEGSPNIAAQVTDYIHRSAPQVILDQATLPEDFTAFMRGGARADAVIIGPNPAGAKALDILRLLHSEAAQVPAIVLSTNRDAEATVAAFQLGAQDYILQKPEYLAELVFSLNNLLRRTGIERENERLTRELETLNRSLEAQVIARTAELQALSKRLLKIQEDERRAIARELHDEVGQLLTGLKLQLEAALHAPPGSQDKIREGLATATTLMAHVRELTQLYRPRVLDDLGLAPALEWHVTQFQRQTGIAVSLDLSLPPGRLPGEIETVVFRITQEALTNVARHARTKTAAVTVTTDGANLLLEISDRGAGFDLTPVLARRDAIGLAGIRERVSLAGGKLELFSRPGQGTRLQVELPLPAS
jgi:signal transduction histidine kinase